MPTNFSSLKANRTNALAKLADEIKREQSKGAVDERFWKLTVDAKTKIGYARIRFLPAPINEDLPWPRLYNHNFSVNNQWFIENCPTTLGSQRLCPVCAENSQLWNTPGADKNGMQDIARQRKRSLRYISNILVIEDIAHPENVGKVFLYKYGPKINAMIQSQVNPEFPTDTPMDPFDMWTGADYLLKSQNVGGYQNYEKSKFDAPSELFPGNDDAKELLWQSEHPLLPFVAEDQFKSYEDLEKRFKSVLQGKGKVAPAAATLNQPTAQDAADLADAVQAAPTAKTPKKPRPRVTTIPEPEEDDEIPLPTDHDALRQFFSGITDPTA